MASKNRAGLKPGSKYRAPNRGSSFGGGSEFSPFALKFVKIPENQRPMAKK
jgi:hypothetical protein